MRGGRTGVTSIPEFNVAMFALLLNFPWEFLQTPLYAGMPTAPHWEAIKICTRATLGDVVLTAIEWLAINGKWLDGWSYAATMPTIPWFHGR